MYRLPLPAECVLVPLCVSKIEPQGHLKDALHKLRILSRRYKLVMEDDGPTIYFTHERDLARIIGYLRWKMRKAKR